VGWKIIEVCQIRLATVDILEQEIQMSRNMFVALYIVVLVVVIVTVDILFFRGQSRTFERLLVNIGIVLVDAAFYLVFLNKR
jgi:hypothetical protein